MQYIHEVRRKMLILQEQYETWRIWYCYDANCKKTTCDARNKKIKEITEDLNTIESRYTNMMVSKRYLNST
jgi:hypothetical protein